MFGDIGTSPLYTEQTVFSPADPHAGGVSPESVFGLVSLIVWSVVIVVTVTYLRGTGDAGRQRRRGPVRGHGTLPGASQFFLLLPGWARLPMVFLAAAATVIASQAVISGAFSVTRQAAQLGYLPRLRIAHTSEEQIGQVYVPWINWALLAAVLALVFTFKSSQALAYAFGMAVTGTITITTLLFFYVVRYQWGKPWWLVAIGAAFLLAVDLLFFAANITKLPHGAWLPLLIGIAVFTVLITWQQGRALDHPAAEEEACRLPEEEEDLQGSAARFRGPAARPAPAAAPVPGTCDLPQPGQGHRPAPRCARTSSTTSCCTSGDADAGDRDGPRPHVPPAARLTADAPPSTSASPGTRTDHHGLPHRTPDTAT